MAHFVSFQYHHTKTRIFHKFLSRNNPPLAFHTPSRSVLFTAICKLRQSSWNVIGVFCAGEVNEKRHLSEPLNHWILYQGRIVLFPRHEELQNFTLNGYITFLLVFVWVRCRAFENPELWRQTGRETVNAGYLNENSENYGFRLLKIPIIKFTGNYTITSTLLLILLLHLWLFLSE